VKEPPVRAIPRHRVEIDIPGDCVKIGPIDLVARGGCAPVRADVDAKPDPAIKRGNPDQPRLGTADRDRRLDPPVERRQFDVGLAQEGGVAVAEAAEQLGRALDVGEQEGDGAFRRVTFRLSSQDRSRGA